MNGADTDDSKLMRAIELLGAKVAPTLRQELAVETL
jgi:hypothetical protein